MAQPGDIDQNSVPQLSSTESGHLQRFEAREKKKKTATNQVSEVAFLLENEHKQQYFSLEIF
jgi:hypothetical protein